MNLIYKNIAMRDCEGVCCAVLKVGEHFHSEQDHSEPNPVTSAEPHIFSQTMSKTNSPVCHFLSQWPQSLFSRLNNDICGSTFTSKLFLPLSCPMPFGSLCFSALATCAIRRPVQLQTDNMTMMTFCYEKWKVISNTVEFPSCVSPGNAALILC